MTIDEQIREAEKDVREAVREHDAADERHTAALGELGKAWIKVVNARAEVQKASLRLQRLRRQRDEEAA